MNQQTLFDSVGRLDTPLIETAIAIESPVVFDPGAGAVARDEAIDRVEKAAAADWKAKALEAVRQCCLLNREFIPDQVWKYLDEKPKEPRAFGAVMQRAGKAGYCIKTERFRPSIIASNHRAPKRVWRSLLLQGA